MLIYVLSSLLWCPFRFPYENDVRFIFTSYCLFTLFVFVYVLRCQTHIVLFFFLRLMYRTLCCQLLWIVYFVLPLRYSGADPGFQVRGGALKNLRRAEGAAKILGYFVWKITILRQKIIFFPISGGARAGCAPPLDPPLVFSNTYLLQK